MQALQALWSARTGAAIWVDLGQSWPGAAVQWCCSIQTDNQADVPRCGDSFWTAAPLLRGLLCWSEQGSAEKQNCCLSSFLVKRSGRERNIQRDPCPHEAYPCPGVLKTSWSWNRACAQQCWRRISAKTLTPCGFCKCLCIYFSLFERQKSSFRPLLGPLQSRAIRRFIIKRRLRGDLWNYSWAVLCTGYKLQRYSMGRELQWAWDILHYGEKGSLKPAGRL